GVLGREGKSAREARFRAIVVAGMMLADAEVDPDGGVGIGKPTQVLLAQGGGFGIATQAAEEVCEITQGLAMARLRCQRGAIRGESALSLAGSFEREPEVVLHARVRRRAREHRLVGRDRLGKVSLRAIQICEMEPRVRMTRIELQCAR